MANHNITITAQDKTRATLQNIDQNLDRVTRRSLMLKGALGIAGAAFAALGAVSVVKNVIDDMDNLAKAARNVGVTSEEQFAKFQVVSKLLEEGGISAGETDRAFRNLTSRMQAGLNGNKQYAEVMEKLGDSIFDANGNLKDAPDLFIAVAQAMQTGTIDMTDAQKILGEVVGPKVLGLFEDMAAKGTSVGEALSDVAGSMNIVSIEDANRAEAFNDALARLQGALTGLLQEALVPILPAMTEFVQDLAAKAPGYLESFSAAMTALNPLFDALGAVLTDYVVPIVTTLFDIFTQLASALQPLAEATLPIINELFNNAATIVGLLIDAMAPLIEQSIPYLVSGLESLKEIQEFIITQLTNMGEKFTKVKEKVTEFAGAVGEQFSGMKDKVSSITEDTVNTVKSWWEWLSDTMYENSIVPDMKEAIIKEFEEMEDMTTKSTQRAVTEIASDYDRLAKVLEGKVSDMKKSNSELAGSFKTTSDEIKSSTDDFMTNFNESFNSTFADALVEGNLSFQSFAGLFKSTMKQLITDALNGGNQLSNIFGSITGGGAGAGGGNFLSGLFGGGGGGGFLSGLFGGGGFFGNMFGGISNFFSGLWGGVTDFFGGLFGGFFADGGFLPAGQFGIVGEAGPEIITGPANITPMDKMSAPAVNITIQAIDTQTGTEFLIKNKKQIEGIIQSAYNRVGKQGIY